MKSIVRKPGLVLFSLAVLAVSLSCGKKSTGGSDDSGCDTPPDFVLSGTWTMNVTVTGGSQLPRGTQFTATVEFQQSDDGEIAGTTRAEGGLTANLTGRVCGSEIEFTLTQNAPCPGTFRGTGILQNGFHFTGSYSGRDCNGTMEADVEAMVQSPVALSGNTVWSGTVDIYSTVIVPPGVTLTLRPGTRIRARTDQSELAVAGSLTATGTPDSLIVFDFDPVSTRIGLWFGVNLRFAESAEMEYCTVRSALRGINVAENSGDIRIRRCRIESGCFGFLNNGKPIRLHNMTFMDNRYSSPGASGYYRTGNTAYSDTLTDCVFYGNRADVYIQGEQGGNLVRVEGGNFSGSPIPLEIDDRRTGNSTISVTRSFGLAEMDSTIGTNRLVVTDALAVPNPAAGCGF